MTDAAADGAGWDWARARRAARVLTGGAVGATTLTLLGVPAGTLVGAVLGSVAANRVGVPQRLPRGLQVVGLVLLGTVAGIRLDQETLAALAGIALPFAASILALIVLDVGLAVVLTRRYGVDPVTALLACAPGGISEVLPAARDLGAHTATVLAIHMVRVLLVVLVILPVLVALLGGGR